MAREQQRLAANVAGPFYVDRSCIDCGTCWQFDPAHFAPTGDSSHVHRQPQGDAETRQALLALQACPVAAIGTSRELLAHTPADGFPALVDSRPEGDVYYCGWASRKSFGASSWLIVRRRADGSADNVLIDSPRWRGRSRRWAASSGSCSATATMWPTMPPGPATSAASAGSMRPMPMRRRRRNTSWRARGPWHSMPTCS